MPVQSAKLTVPTVCVVGLWGGKPKSIGLSQRRTGSRSKRGGCVSRGIAKVCYGTGRGGKKYTRNVLKNAKKRGGLKKVKRGCLVQGEVISQSRKAYSSTGKKCGAGGPPHKRRASVWFFHRERQQRERVGLPRPAPQRVPSARCEHGRRRDVCWECKLVGTGGGSLCEHGKQRCVCKLGCGGGSYCKHGIARSACAESGCGGGGELCEHGKRRRVCRFCNALHVYYGLQVVNGNTSLLEQKFRRTFVEELERICGVGGDGGGIVRGYDVKWNKRVDIEGRRFFPDVWCWLDLALYSTVKRCERKFRVFFIVEVDGGGHYQVLHLKNRSKPPVQELRDQVHRDDMLMEWCLMSGVLLFRIPETGKRDFGFWIQYILSTVVHYYVTHGVDAVDGLGTGESGLECADGAVGAVGERGGGCVWLLDFGRSFADLVGGGRAAGTGRQHGVRSRLLHWAVCPKDRELLAPGLPVGADVRVLRV